MGSAAAAEFVGVTTWSLPVQPVVADRLAGKRKEVESVTAELRSR